MKLFICGWRPWTVLGRYKSLMLNAQRLGHDVLGIASEHLGTQAMTRKAFAEIGVRATHGGRAHTKDVLDEFQPDAVFGEQYWNCPEEVMAKRWARENGARHLVLDHDKNYMTPSPLGHHKKLGAGSTLLTATERAAEVVVGHTGAKVVVVGMPQYDLVFEDYDVAGIRENLGVADGQKLIFLTLTHGEGGEPYPAERQYLMPFLDLAAKREWRVVCSPHPTERSSSNKLRWSKRAAYLGSMQEKGVLFASDFDPGTANGILFERCTIFELLAACDGVIGSSLSVGHPAYAMGKEYFHFTDHHWGEIGNARQVEPGFEQFIEAVERGSPWEQDERTTREFFYKLDGLVWERILKEVEDGS